MNNLAPHLAYTNLSPTLTARDVERVTREAKESQVVELCLPPFWIKKARRELGSTNVQLVTVAGFPLGYQMTQTKTAEIEQAIQDGADEIDMVMNVSAFKSGMPWVKIEIAKCATLAHSHGVLLKIMIEMAYLNEAEATEAGTQCVDAGADFVATSTGFASQGATVAQVQQLRQALPAQVGIKTCGEIETASQVRAMIEAGADRIGTSSAIDILRQ